MKILLALDGSDGSILARDFVTGLALPAGSEVHLVGAYQVPTQWASDLGAGLAWIDDAETELRAGLSDQLDELGRPIETTGVTTIPHVRCGRPASVILDLADEIGPDLVVTGSRGRGALASVLLGSVATEVATHARVPVLVARSARVHRLLVATDGSPSVACIPNALERWGVFRGVPADVVSVSIPDSPTFELIVGLYTLGNARLAAKRRDLRDQYRSDAETMAARLEAIGVPATAHVRSGDPAHEIVAAAQEASADLVITGHRGLGGIDRLLLGSVARTVLVHAPTSVLVVRPGPDASAA
jgi:nucleotide-binding universal stress UspA family protein